MSQPFEIHVYRPAWAHIAAAEQQLLHAACGSLFVALEHIGSTAVPGLAAKPVIDLMGAVTCLAEVDGWVTSLAARSFEQVATSKPRRLLLRKPASAERPQVHLHIVEAATWDERNERLFRDWLRCQTEHATAYAALKRQLAQAHGGNIKAYTAAKTGFVQAAVAAARSARGLSPVPWWETPRCITRRRYRRTATSDER